MQLWRVPEACAVTTVQTFPRAKVCMILLCGGENMKAWIHHVDDICDWARKQGCDAVEIPGRRGWKRVLNWDIPWIMYRKML